MVLRWLESGRAGKGRAEKLVRSLEPRVRAVHADYVRVARCLAAAEVLQAALGLLEKASNVQFAPLVDGLTRLAGPALPPSGHVQFAPLQKVEAALSEASARGGGALGDALTAAVESVTLAGVAAMFGTLPERAAIVTAIVESRYPWVSPMWGGTSTYAAPRRSLVVLPPMRDDDYEALRREAEARCFAPALRRADSAASGCAVVALDFFEVKAREDVLPAFYASQPELETAAGAVSMSAVN